MFSKHLHTFAVMSKEIERKFLVRSDNFKAEAFKCFRIEQGYLNSDPARTVRVRIRDNKGYLTIKGESDTEGISRFEWEIEIPLADAENLIKLAEKGIIRKERYLMRNTDGKHIWEVDIFHGENEGLIVAEIELGQEDESFDKPDWLGDEVTGDKRYYNSSLRIAPYSKWEKD